MWHRISEVDIQSKTGICSICGPVRIKSRGTSLKKNGDRKYRCRTSFMKYKSNNKKVYRKHKKDRCESCGFIPVSSVQLDVDHIDGNNKNNNLDNLQTLCANCHRLKTFLNNDYIKKEATPF